MPNFCTNPLLVSLPVWVENPTDQNLTWRYDSEYTTFEPGVYKNLETGEYMCMDLSIAVHFQKSLPALVIHTTMPPKTVVTKSTVNLSKPISEMSMQELRLLGKEKGKSFRVGMTKEQLAAEIQELINNE